MSFGLPERNGLSVGIGSWATLSAGVGAGGRNRRALMPHLIIDFVPSNTLASPSLSMNFAAQSYITTVRDPLFPNDFVDIQVWI